MIELSIAQVEYLKVEVSRVGLSYSHLRDDLTDHICCDVEYEMQNGLPFEKAYEKVKQKVGIDGLMRIQHETLYLIDKKYRIMKKLMKISGLIAPILLGFGAIFKMMHWPGAGILLVLGFFALSFLFLPSAIYVSYREVSNKTKIFAHITGFIGTFFLSVSFLFKVMHWPGTGFIMFAGIILICLLFIPVLLVSKLKSKELHIPTSVLVTAFSGLSMYLLGFLFKIMHWPGAAILLLLGIVLMIFIGFPIYVYRTYKNEDHVNNQFIYMIVVIIWFILPTMLMTQNIQLDYLRSSTVYTSGNLETDKVFFEKTNADLYQKLINNKNTLELKYKTEKLNAYIQELKLKIILINPKGRNAIENSKICYDKINFYSEVGAYHFVLFGKEKYAEKLIDQLNEYKKFIEKLAPGSSSQIAYFTRDLLQANPDMVLITALNKLTTFQITNLEAENIALKKLIQQEEQKNLLAKN